MENPIRVLLIQNESIPVHTCTQVCACTERHATAGGNLARDLLSRGPADMFQIFQVDPLYEECERLCCSEQIDVLLADLSCSDSMGIETLERMRACAPHLPIVVLTGTSDEAAAIQALPLGIVDCIPGTS